jgi:cytochrome c oxidase subunit 3
MTTQASTDHQKYYVPDSSPLAVMATIGLVLSVFGAASYMNDLSFGEPGEASPSILYAGAVRFRRDPLRLVPHHDPRKPRGHEQPAS